MRCRSALACVALAMCAGAAAAAPEDARRAAAARLAQQLPGLEAAEYALGSAAFDDELRRAQAEHAGEVAAVVEAGRKLWTRKFRNGRSLANCFPNGGRRVASAYPLYNPGLKMPVTLELAVNQCLKAHGEPLFEPSDPETMGAVVAYLRSLARGRKIEVRVPEAARKHFEQGERLYATRMGQRNFACASCHLQGAGKRYGEMPLSPAVGQATHWPLVRGDRAVTLHARIRECLELMGAAPFPAGSDELNAIEYYLTYLSNGLPLGASAWRP